MTGKFSQPGGLAVGRNRPAPAALGVFVRPGAALPQGFVPGRPGRRGGIGITPALHGMDRAGRVVGVSQINAIASVVWRG
jgi:hypothetical protein